MVFVYKKLAQLAVRGALPPRRSESPVCATDNKPSCVLHLLGWFIGSRGFPSLERRPEFWVLHRRILYCLSHQKSPKILECIAYPFSRGTSWPRVSCFAGRFFSSWATRVQRLIYIEAIEKKIPGVCPERKEFSGTHNSCFYLRNGAAGWMELEGKNGTSAAHLWARHFPGALFT